MTYAIGLYIIPKNPVIPNDDFDNLRSLVYGSGADDLCLCSTDFSGYTGWYFEQVFDVVLTNREYYRLVDKEHFKEVLIRLGEVGLDEYQMSRTMIFINKIKTALEEGKDLFFWCD